MRTVVTTRGNMHCFDAGVFVSGIDLTQIATVRSVTIEIGHDRMNEVTIRLAILAELTKWQEMRWPLAALVALLVLLLVVAL